MVDTTSILELLHPDGRCPRTLLLGLACPERLQPANSAQHEKLDLVLFAPGAGQARDPKWVEDTLTSAATRLAADGLLCALLPPQHRRRAGRMLGRYGLEAAWAFLYRGSETGEDEILPLDGASIQYVLTNVPSGYTRSGRLKARLLGLPGIPAILRRWHRGAWVVGRHPGARPLFNWFLQSITPQPASTAVINAKWRRGRGSVVVRALTAGGRLAAVAKLTLGKSAVEERISKEAEFLARAGEGLRQIGLSIPDARVLPGELGTPVLLESVVPGDLAAALLLSQRISSSALLASLGERLLAWSRKTVVSRKIDAAWIEREVLRPADEIVPLLEDGEKYGEWLRARCLALTGADVPLVATHGDLTMWNVLVTTRGSLGIVDWEAGTLEGLPLRDLCYAAWDITSAAHRYSDRVGAFRKCFEVGGPEGRQLSRLLTQLGQALGLSRNSALLCFHACWLQHAVEETGKRSSRESRPFLEILRQTCLATRTIRHRWVSGVSDRGLRRVDWRFLLPAHPAGRFEHLVLLGGDTELAEMLTDRGIAGSREHECEFTRRG